MARILVIESQPSTRLALRRFLESEGHTCEVASTLAGARGDHFDLALVDAELLGSREAMRSLGAPSVVVLTAPGAPAWAPGASVAASIGKPLDFRELADLMPRCLDPGRAAAAPPATSETTGPILTRSPAMLRILDDVARLAPFDITVLITGESGTGKELVARALHEQSPRREEPFEAIHCGAIVADLLESELFGHEKGSFTDAHATKPGRFEIAGAGTIFLDEIGEMPLALQVKLLRALQEREIQRIGGLKTIPVRARIVAATHRDLRSLVVAGSFREDLLHRLQVATLHLPPLRDRPEDVELLAHEFLRACAAEHDRPTRGFSVAALACLTQRLWPGNVRELQNVVQRAVILAPGPLLEPEDLVDGAADAEAGAGWPRALALEIQRRRRDGESMEAIRSALRADVDRAVDAGGSRPAGDTADDGHYTS